MTLAPNGPLIERRDTAGRPIPLTSRWTGKPAVLFTGAAGLGTTAELNRAHRAAEAAGALVLRVKATGNEPLENNFARTIANQLGTLRRVHGRWRMRGVKKVARELTRQIGEKTPMGGVRTPSPGGLLPQYEFKFKDQVRSRPPATLNDLADAAGELARQKNLPAMIVIDDIHRASLRDLAAINELAEHLEQTGLPVVLAMSGGENAPTLLHKASRGIDGRAGDLGRLYDIRKCEPFTDQQLRPMLRYALAKVVPMEIVDAYCPPPIQQQLLQAANGNAGRLSDLVGAAVECSKHGVYSIDDRAASWAVQAVDTGRAAAYEAAWNDSSPEEKRLLVWMADAGPDGLDIVSAVNQLPPGDLAAWAQFDAARQSLDGRGLIDVSADGGRLEFSSPGLRNWVAHHNPAWPAGRAPVPDHLVPGGARSGQAPAGYRPPGSEAHRAGAHEAAGTYGGGRHRAPEWRHR
ncbi:AAA family ATPase [Kribbella sp. NPDC048915]|uniref:AAA family ATPase n=1 Tax=Kribbella sp. NPDC048915 TaxID=3155148 RepID=UPI0033CF4DCE